MNENTAKLAFEIKKDIEKFPFEFKKAVEDHSKYQGVDNSEKILSLIGKGMYLIMVMLLRIWLEKHVEMEWKKKLKIVYGNICII